MSTFEGSINCINILKEYSSPNYFNKWESIKNVYKQRLDSITAPTEVFFTPHDYSNHCINIYRILDMVIPSVSIDVHKRINDKPCGKINIEHFFILDVAVLLHDYIMTINPERRFNHSEEAKEYILSQLISSGETILKQHLTAQEAEFVSDVVLGHCDIKFTDKKINTIDLISEGFKNGAMGIVNTKLLSALIRFADELDINSDRIKDKQHFEKKIREIDQKCVIDGKTSESPLPHWRKCEIMAFPNKSDIENTTINLRINEYIVKNQGNKENDILLILDVKKKIQNELNMLNKKVFSKNNFIDGWTLNKIDIYTEDAELKHLIIKESDPFTSTNVPQLPSEPLKITDIQFADKINNWVYNEKLLESGHFYIDENIHVRDWINTQKLLTNRDHLNDISNKFIEYIKSKWKDEKIFILGEGYPGIILSSTIGFKLSTPFSYVIPEKDFVYHNEQEKDIKIFDNNKIILVTDLIMRGDTILNLMKWLKEKYKIDPNQILSILTIFVRKPKLDDINFKTLDTIKEKIFVLNDSFETEICECDPKTCIFKTKGLVSLKYEPF